MIRPGLVSVTFRRLTPQEIVALAIQAAQEGIEWGGDVHVPPGDLSYAREVARLTRDAGLEVASYASYYRLEGDGFETVLETAVALTAPHIRVWAGRTGSAAAADAERARLIEDGRRIAGLAQTAGIALSFEFHQGTFCDTAESTLSLLDEIDAGNFGSYWQPRTEEGEGGLAVLNPHVTNLHVFQWIGQDRRPLAEGEAEWRRYLDIVGPQKDRWALLEFVADDSPERYLRDAQTLREWLSVPVVG